jgi:hypothetical protein
MKHLIATSLVLIGSGLMTPALAVDDFGARFSNDTPAALDTLPAAKPLIDDMDAQAARDIEPAAGGEEADTEKPADYPAVPLSSEVENDGEQDSNTIETNF